MSNKPDISEKNDKKPIKIINYYGASQHSNSYLSSGEEEKNTLNNCYDSILKNLYNKPQSKSRYASTHQQETQNYFENNVEENNKDSMRNRSLSQTNINNFFSKNENAQKNTSVILEENEEYTKKTQNFIMVNEEENEFLYEQPKEIENNDNNEFITFNRIKQNLFKQEQPLEMYDNSGSALLELTSKNKKLEKELESVILELKQVKMEWALTEERKEETEVKLKNEIKCLLNKMIQNQNNKNPEDHSRNLSLNISGIKDNLKESILSRTSRSRSPSIYKPPSSGIKVNKVLTPKITQNIYKTEEFEDDGENQKKCSNNSFTMPKTMRDLNKHKY